MAAILLRCLFLFCHIGVTMRGYDDFRGDFNAYIKKEKKMVNVKDKLTALHYPSYSRMQS